MVHFYKVYHGYWRGGDVFLKSECMLDIPMHLPVQTNTDVKKHFIDKTCRLAVLKKNSITNEEM